MLYGITYTSSLRHAATLGLALLNLCRAPVQYIRIACESDRTLAAHTRSFGSDSHGTTVGFSLSYNQLFSHNVSQRPEVYAMGMTRLNVSTYVTFFLFHTQNNLYVFLLGMLPQ